MLISLVLALIGLAAPGIGTRAPDSLQAGFTTPPGWAKPHTWWHWIDGNITKEGITADLEAMKQGGLGGAHIFNAGSFGGDDGHGGFVAMPKGPVVYNTPEWRALMVHAFSEAKRLGLEITIHNCAGWSSSGGPWVKPDDAMKRVVWATNNVTGPGRVDLELKRPGSVRGYYKDIAVFAIPETAFTSRPDGHQWYLTGLGDNDGQPFAPLSWPIVPRRSVTDVTAFVKDGKLTWAAPAGKWTILRMGYTLTGAQNVASPDSGRGLEVDKFSTEAFDHYFDGGLLPLIKKAGPLAGDSWTTVLIDSYETGHQNWTPKMREEFKSRRGYDMMRFLPALAGVAVDSAEATERFLFDFRRTLEELWGDNYSGHFAKRLSEFKMKLGVEPYGNGNFNALTYAEPAGLIMGEYWVGEGTINSSVHMSASVAHVLGRKVVGAEALTAGEGQAGWRNQPSQWKPFADRGYINGINRIIYHRFTHQPWASGVLPGMTMGPWGSHNDRTTTWWPMASDWNTYLSRCQYLLQSGRFFADVCLYSGEDAPQAGREEMHGTPEVPYGYDYDTCPAMLLLKATVKDGQVVLPSGMTYRVLALPDTDRMSAAVARKVRELVAAGATVVGPAPKETVGVRESGKPDAGSYSNKPLAEALGDIHLQPDFRCWTVIRGLNKADDVWRENATVRTIHRRIGDVDAYFVSSFGHSGVEGRCFFRIEGRKPELWHPETGVVEDAPVWRTVSGGVEVPLRFGPAGSVFVVFRSKPDVADSVALVQADLPPEPAGAQPKVIKAEYGVLGDDSKTKDVTAIVADAIATSGEVSASNDSMGGDPAVNIVKQLRVAYLESGKEQTVTVPENDTVRLGTAQPTSPPAYEMRLVSGKPELLAWQTGKFAVTTAAGHSLDISAEVPDAIEVAGPWTVSFPPGWDAPATTTFDSLASWTDSAEFGIKYFSGTATYSKTFIVPPDLLGEGKRLALDLGAVREIAQVKLNGKDLGIRWWAPYRYDVTDVVKPGENTLEVRVTNLWVNRLVGDEQFPDDIGWQGITFSKWPDWLDKFVAQRATNPALTLSDVRPEPRRKTFTTWHHNTKDTPLMPSGLLGPVMLRPVRVYPVAAK